VKLGRIVGPSSPAVVVEPEDAIVEMVARSTALHRDGLPCSWPRIAPVGKLALAYVQVEALRVVR
jgi:hypothetical protein